jgi:hypothetical protein
MYYFAVVAGAALPTVTPLLSGTSASRVPPF